MLTKKLYRFISESTNQKFTELLTAEGAASLALCLPSNWNYTSDVAEMMKYNSIIESDDYKKEVEQFMTIYKGANLAIRMNNFHRILGIRPLEGREIFELFKL